MLVYQSYPTETKSLNDVLSTYISITVDAIDRYFFLVEDRIVSIEQRSISLKEIVYKLCNKNLCLAIERIKIRFVKKRFLSDIFYEWGKKRLHRFEDELLIRYKERVSNRHFEDVNWTYALEKIHIIRLRLWFERSEYHSVVSKMADWTF